GIPLLHRIWSAETWLWRGLTDWRSLSDEEHSPRRLLLRLQNEGWFMPLFHHWLSMESRVGVHGVRMTALGWFDFQRAWIKPEV
ncbi:MAG: HTH-type transcriptional regulator SgrR, partial [Aeromonas sp.]